MIKKNLPRAEALHLAVADPLLIAALQNAAVRDSVVAPSVVVVPLLVEVAHIAVAVLLSVVVLRIRIIAVMPSVAVVHIIAVMASVAAARLSALVPGSVIAALVALRLVALAGAALIERKTTIRKPIVHEAPGLVDSALPLPDVPAPKRRKMMTGRSHPRGAVRLVHPAAAVNLIA